jgi:hypothetical protein
MRFRITEFTSSQKLHLSKPKQYKNPECILKYYRGADKSLALPGRKQATATEDFEFHISYL